MKNQHTLTQAERQSLELLGELQQVSDADLTEVRAQVEQGQGLLEASHARFSDLPEVLAKIEALLASAEAPSTEDQTFVGGKTGRPSARRGKINKAEPIRLQDSPGERGEDADGEPDQTIAPGTRSKSRRLSKVGRSKSQSQSESRARSSIPSQGGKRTADYLSELESAKRYEVIEEVGRGGCGVVRKATDLHLKRNVVLKEVLSDFTSNEEIVRRFIHEARITGQLEHPGIVPVHDLGVDGAGNPYFAMKEVRGETLGDRIQLLHEITDRTQKELRTRLLLNRFRSVCDTLGFAHQANVIHRDIKPANIMVGEFGETIILDWGLARQLKQSNSEIPESEEFDGQQTVAASKKSKARQVESEKHTAAAEKPDGRKIPKASDVVLPGSSAPALSHCDMTTQGSVMGTPAYMSPEQAQGKNEVLSQRSDVFSLGVVLYEILTGDCPFRCADLDTTLTRVAKCDFRPPTELNKRIPRPLAAICLHAMQADPAARYANAAEMGEDLERFLAGGSVSVYQEPVWEALDRTAENHRWLFRSAFAFALIIAVVALLSVARISSANRLEQLASQEALKAQGRAEAALVHERDARTRAQEQLIASREAADSWLVGLSSSLQFYPGLDGIRQGLVRQGIDHYQETLVSAGESWEAMEQRGEMVDPSELICSFLEWNDCKIRLGDLLRLNRQTGEATQFYREVAEANSSRLGEISPGITDAHLLQTRMLIQLSNAHIGLALSAPVGRNDEVRSGLEECVKQLHDLQAHRIWSQLTSTGAAEAELRFEFHNTLARALLVLSRLETEGATSVISLLDEACLSAQADVPSNSEQRQRQLIATILEEKARRQVELLDYAAACVTCRELLEHYDAALELEPNRPDLRESRSLVASMLASCLLAQHDAGKAEVAFAEAARDLDAAWELTYGETFYRENKGVLAENRSRMYSLQGRMAEAETSVRDAIAEYRWVLQTQGVTESRVRSMLTCYHDLLRLSLIKEPSVEIEEEVRSLLDFSHVLVSHLGEAAEEQLHLSQQVLHVQAAEWSRDLDTLHKLYRQIKDKLAHVDESILGELGREVWQLRTVAANADIATGTEIEEWLETWCSVSKENEQQFNSVVHALEFLVQLDAAQDEGSSAEWKHALRQCEGWLRKQPNSPKAWHWVAVCQMQCGEHVTADESLRRAIGLRGGTYTIADELLAAVIAVQTGDESAETQRKRAVEQFVSAVYRSPVEIFLHKLLQ